MTYTPSRVDPNAHISLDPEPPADAQRGTLWYDATAGLWKVCTDVGPPAVFEPVPGPVASTPAGGPAQSIEQLDHLPAVETGRILYLTRTVGPGYEADRLYIGVP
jgi:hypothetical protein